MPRNSFTFPDVVKGLVSGIKRDPRFKVLSAKGDTLVFSVPQGNPEVDYIRIINLSGTKAPFQIHLKNGESGWGWDAYRTDVAPKFTDTQNVLHLDRFASPSVDKVKFAQHVDSFLANVLAGVKHAGTVFDPETKTLYSLTEWAKIKEERKASRLQKVLANPSFFPGPVKIQGTAVSVPGKEPVQVSTKELPKYGLVLVIQQGAREVRYEIPDKLHSFPTIEHALANWIYGHAAKMPNLPVQPAKPAEAPGVSVGAVKSFLRGLNYGVGGRAIRVETEDGPHPYWTVETTNRQRLDHYVGGYDSRDPDDDDYDPEGWDSDSWEEEYAGPVRQRVQKALDGEFGKDVLDVEIGEKGHVDVTPGRAWKSQKVAALIQRVAYRYLTKQAAMKPHIEVDPTGKNGLAYDVAMQVQAALEKRGIVLEFQSGSRSGTPVTWLIKPQTPIGMISFSFIKEYPNWRSEVWRNQGIEGQEFLQVVTPVSKRALRVPVDEINPAEIAKLTATLARLIKPYVSKTAQSSVFDALYLPLVRDKEDIETVTSDVRDFLFRNFRETFKVLDEKLKPFKTQGSRDYSNSKDISGRYDTTYYSYTVTYPETVFLGWSIKLDLNRRWEAAHALPHVKTQLKGQTPPLTNVAAAEMIKIAQTVLEDVDFDYLSRQAEDTIEDWMFSKFAANVQVETTTYNDDGEEEVASESADPEVHFRYKPGKLKFDLDAQGTQLLVKFTLPVEVSVKDVAAPGDHDYRRASAEQK